MTETTFSPSAPLPLPLPLPVPALVVALVGVMVRVLGWCSASNLIGTKVIHTCRMDVTAVFLYINHYIIFTAATLETLILSHILYLFSLTLYSPYLPHLQAYRKLLIPLREDVNSLSVGGATLLSGLPPGVLLSL